MKGFQIIRRGGTERVFQELPQGSERARDYRALPRAVRQENVYMSAMYQHPHDPVGEPTTMECVIGDNSSERASEFLRIVMLFVNQAVVQPCADIVQPSMRSIDEVTTAALTSRSLIHETLWSLATKTLEMLGLEDKANLTAEQESRVLAVFLMTELLLKVERGHRPAGMAKQTTSQPTLSHSFSSHYSLLPYQERAFKVFLHSRSRDRTPVGTSGMP
jgi:hypothetical protein